VFVLTAGVASALAVVASATGLPRPGVEAVPGGLVAHVVPGGAAWRQGIRVGQVVVGIEPGGLAEEWDLTVRAGDGVVRASAASMLETLRETTPVAALASVFAAIALLLLRTQAAIAAAVAVIAAGLATGPLMAAGEMVTSSAAGVTGLLLPAVWLVTWWPQRRAIGRHLAVLSAAAAVAWLGARLTMPDLYDPLDALRLIVTYGLLVLVVGTVISGSAWRRHGGYDMRRRSDIAMLAAAVAVTALLLGLGTPATVVALVVGLALAAYPIVRGRAADLLGELVLGDIRERASMAAIEDERGRLARELHDAPLQELVAVIRRIDRHPDLAAEATTLRGVAERLRDVTTRLRPPVLEDLGLGAALAFLVDATGRGSNARIVLELSEPAAAGIGARLPADVELALFRIVQEALSNALAHSAAERITISGSVAPERVELSVVDDGVGLDAVAIREAQARGRMGLRSMAQRAALIDAELRVEPLEHGTRVSVRWPG
jgi:two-component system NarL family sensor kinase